MIIRVIYGKELTNLTHFGILGKIREMAADNKTKPPNS
jgi:hypothetical protein